MHPLEEKVLRFIRDRHMILPGGRVVIGLSGGADSTALLRILCALREELSVTLLAVHVHHGIRGEAADADAAFSARLCTGLGVPFEEKRLDVPGQAGELGLGTEETARLLRYRVLRRAAGEDGRIAVAHHLSDQAETVLLNLIRGTGLAGLSGMRPVSGQVIRPLLYTEKEEILAYLRDLGQDYRTDETNADQAFARNRVRHSVLPLLSEINPEAERHIARAAEAAAAAQEMLEKEAERILEACGKAEEGRMSLPVSVLLEAEPALRRELLHRMVPGGRRDIGAVHLRAMEDLLTGETGRQIPLPGGRRARRSYEWLIAETAGEEKGPEDLSGAFSFRVYSRGKDEKITENRYTKSLDYDKIKKHPEFRTRREGDYLTLRGGKKKSIKTYMIDRKIPRPLREKIPLAAAGSHVLWVVGYRVSDSLRAGPETERVLEITYLGGKDGREDQSPVN